MQPILKLTFVFLFAQLLAINGFAQTNEKAFVGTWQMKQCTYNERPVTGIPAGVLKIFNADKTFANMQVQNQKPITTHSGSYKVEDGFYLEKALQRMPGVINNEPLGKDFKINYSFSEDKQQLTLSFTAVTGIRVVEIWQKQNSAI